MTHAVQEMNVDAQTNLPEPMAQLQRAFDMYEDALVHNKVNVLDALFWDSPHTLRYGAKENLKGYDQIKAFRASRPNAGLNREILDRNILTFGHAWGVANVTFRRAGELRIGRQSQTWVRLNGDADAGADRGVADGWRVVSAHVSWMDV
jgi:hypothetical protein